MKLYIFGMFEDCKGKGVVLDDDTTMNESWRVVVESLEAAYDGVFQQGEECAGQELAGGFFLVVWCLKGDLDYFAKGLHLRHYTRNEFCEFCPAHSNEAVPAMLWSNFRVDAGW